MNFSYRVDVEVERTQGKFASRGELGEQLNDALESANPDSLTAENEGEYDVVTWDVTEEDAPKTGAPRTVVGMEGLGKLRQAAARVAALYWETKDPMQGPASPLERAIEVLGKVVGNDAVNRARRNLEEERRRG